MHTSVHLSDDERFVLAHAVLVYSSGARAFATVHEPLDAPDGGAPLLGPGQLVTRSALTQLTARLGLAAPLEVLPEAVVVRTADTLAWWTPAATRPMFFEPGGAARDGKDREREALRAVSGRRFPHPPLLWLVIGSHLWLRALPVNARPTAETPLCVAPYWNTNVAGSVCQGTMASPRDSTTETMRAWEAGYFGSAFTHGYGVLRHTKHAAGFAGLWTGLADAPAFPLDTLVPANETLGTFLAACARTVADGQPAPAPLPFGDDIDEADEIDDVNGVGGALDYDADDDVDDAMRDRVERAAA